MNNLLAGTGIGTIFVDHQLRILRFTPQITQLINLIPIDIGRPIGDIFSNLLGYNHLVDDIKEVINSLIPKDIEVQTQKGYGIYCVSGLIVPLKMLFKEL